MKYWICMHCGRHKTSEDNIVMKWCGGCMELMEEEKKEVFING